MSNFGSKSPIDQDDDEGEEDDSSTSHYMTNTSRVDVTQDPASAYYARFPHFVEHVVPLAKQAVVEPGDLLFMPPG